MSELYWPFLFTVSCLFLLRCIDISYSCMLSHFSHVWHFATLWTVASQALQSIGFSRKEYWSGLPFHPPGDLPHPGTEPMIPASPALAGRFWATWEALRSGKPLQKINRKYSPVEEERTERELKGRERVQMSPLTWSSTSLYKGCGWRSPVW